MDFFEKVTETVTTVGKEAADKAKELVEIARLKNQTATCEDIIKKNYLELGKLYYEKYGENPEAGFEKQCRSIKNAKHGAEEIQKQIDGIRGL